MTRWLLFLVLVSPLCFAKNRKIPADNDNYSTDLMSLNFYPHPDLFEINPHVTTTFHDRSENSSFRTMTREANEIANSFIYGFAQQLRVSVTETLLWDANSDAVGVGGVDTVNSSNGLSNPTVAVSWRFLEDAQNGFSGDLTLSATPSLGPAVLPDGSISRMGNNLSGYTSAGLTAVFFWRAGMNQISLSGLESRHFSGRDEGPTSTTSYNVDPVSVTTVALTDRLHFGAQYFVQASGALTASYQTQQTTDTDVTSKVTSPLYVDPRVDFAYRPEPGVVLMVGVTSHVATSEAEGPKGVIVSSKNTMVTGIFTMLHQF